MIDGLDAAAASPGCEFPSRHGVDDGKLLAAGGRVLTICAIGPDLEAARTSGVYAAD